MKTMTARLCSEAALACLAVALLLSVGACSETSGPTVDVGGDAPGSNNTNSANNAPGDPPNGATSDTTSTNGATAQGSGPRAVVGLCSGCAVMTSGSYRVISAVAPVGAANGAARSDAHTLRPDILHRAATSPR